VNVAALISHRLLALGGERKRRRRRRAWRNHPDLPLFNANTIAETKTRGRECE